MMRAEKEFKCTAADLVEINLRAFMNVCITNLMILLLINYSFLQVIKTSVSFYTLMKQFKEA